MKYRSWAVVAGYFDGDGTVEEKVGLFVVGVKLGFSDNWPEQLRAVRRFLIEKGLKVGKVFRSRRKGGAMSAWKLVVSNKEAVLTIATEILPHVVKKRAELQGVVDYLTDRISGNEFVRRINREVEVGNKLGKLKKCDLPLSRAQGNKARRELSLAHAWEANLIHVPEKVESAIRSAYATGEFSMRELSLRYSVRIWIVHRILGKRY